MNKEKIQLDIRDNKIKQGMLLKQSRHLKQWKERWMVLTKTHLYSFINKNQYKDPTQLINLKDVETLKSYYKDQYKKQYTFRVESQQVKLHMSAKSSEQKWAWMTAIQKTIDRLVNPTKKPDSFEIVKQSMRISSGVRQTLTKKQIKQQKNLPQLENIMKKMKLHLNSKVIQHFIRPVVEQINNNIMQGYVEQTKDNDYVQQQEQTFFILQKKPKNSKQNNIKQRKEQKLQIQEQKNGQYKQRHEQTKQEQMFLQNIQKQAQNIISESPPNQNELKQTQQKQKVVTVYVQKIVQVPVQRIVEKIVKVPQIKQTFIEKMPDKNGIKQQKSLLTTLKQLIINPNDNPTPLISFIIYMFENDKQKYQKDVLQFCLDVEIRRFFSEFFLIILNNEIQEQKINSYLKFIVLLYQACDDYFYTSDVKALITIVIRQIQMNRSELNQYLLLTVLTTLAQKSWWKQINYRVSQIKDFVREIQSISGEDNKFLAKNLLSIL